MTTANRILFATILRAAGYTSIQLDQASRLTFAWTLLTGSFGAPGQPPRTSILVNLGRGEDITVDIDGVRLALVLAEDGTLALK